MLEAGQDNRQIGADNRGKDNVETMRGAGRAYSDYRQFSRDNYQNQLNNRMQTYQPVQDLMASAYGRGIPVSQLSAEANPLSLRQTGVGATNLSNFAGGVDTRGTTDRNQWTIYNGIGNQMDGSARPETTGYDPTKPVQQRVHNNYSGMPTPGTAAYMANINPGAANSQPMQGPPIQQSQGPGSFAFGPRRP